MGIKKYFFGALISLLLPAAGLCQTPYYQGKTITIVQGRDGGGTGDLRVKAVAMFLPKYIPGNPTIVYEYMPGGGSRRAANHVFKTARPDGLTIGNMSSAMVSLAVLGESGILYDLDKFIYLGSPYSTHHSIFLTKKESGFSNLEKLRAASGVRIGGQSVGFSTYNEGRLFAFLLGLKDPKFVTGYSGREIDVALMSGEIDARSSDADSLVQRNREWFEKGLVDLHTIIETPKGEKHPRFGHLPELETFARSGRERKVLQLQRGFRVAGAPFILPPGTPKEIVTILQEGFRRAFKDPDFHAQYKKMTGDEPSPLLPELHEKTIRELPREPEVIELFKKLVGADPLPPR
ncbi:MAG: hypothetical protein ACREP8_13365 [Candidatus Binatia bacterium]